MASDQASKKGRCPRDAQGPKPSKTGPSDQRRARRRAALNNAKKLRAALLEGLRKETVEHETGGRNLVEVRTFGERQTELARLDREIAQLLWEKKVRWTGEPGHGPKVGVQPGPGNGQRPREVSVLHEPKLAFQSERERMALKGQR